MQLMSETPRPTLPPLSSVRVFEAAARLGSFTQAAAELNMTQAAVSYQVKQLEERLGAPLFLRQPRGVSLTPLGQELAITTTAAFNQLREGFARVQGRSEHLLVISTLPTIAASWLAPRIGSFQLQHPELAVRMETSIEAVDLLQQADVAIRTGNGDWPGLDADFLFPNVFTPLCSPAFARTHRLRSPSQLLRLPRLGRPAWWTLWFQQAGVAAPETPPATAGVEFGIQQMDVASAMAGHGIAIASPLLFADELAAQRLVRPFDTVASDGKGHWLVYATSRRRLKKVQAFRTWLLQQAEALKATDKSG
jgi:LysR family transcriptional regulator, glycine cleavage system transcriptional activator